MIRTLAFLALLPACSVAFQTKPSYTQPVTTNDCTTSRTLPYLDTAGIAAGLTVAGIGLADQEHDNGTALMMAGTAVAFGYLVSAGTGFRWSSECREQHPTPVATR